MNHATTLSHLILALALIPACSGAKNDVPSDPAHDAGTTGSNGGSDGGTELSATPVELGELEVLPAPAAMPSGTIEEQARALAVDIRAGGERSVPALLSALRASGISVRLADGTIAVAPDGAGQGYVIEGWEVQSLAVAESRGFRLPLSTVGTELRGTLAELADAPIEQYVLDGVRTSTGSASPELRFWGNFIIELGARAEDPIDLLGADHSASLGPIQASLLLRRLAFEIADRARVHGLWHVDTSIRALEGSNCQLTETEQEVLDTAAVGTQLLNGELVGYLTDKGVLGSNVAAGQSLANLVLAYAKFAATFAMFKLEMTLSGSPPLVRTKTRTAGEDRDLSVHVTFDPRSPQWVNCVRPALNQLGLDFDLPQAGPVSGAGVKWQLLDGTGHVQFHGDPVHDNFTDASGDSKIVFQGKEQRTKLPDDSMPYELDARVHASVILKPPSFFRDIRDAVNNASVVGLLTTPAEMAYRSEYLFGGSGTFKVRDWHAPGWTAKIAFTVNGKERKMMGTGEAGEPSSTASARYDEVAAGEIWGQAIPPTPGFPAVPTLLQGSVLVTASESYSSRTYSAQYCEGEGEIASIENVVQASASFSGPVDQTMTLTVADDGRWELSIFLPTAELTGSGSSYSAEALHGCIHDYSTSDSSHMKITSGTIVEMLPFHGQLDPADPNHIVVDFPFTAAIELGSIDLPVTGALNIDLVRR